MHSDNLSPKRSEDGAYELGDCNNEIGINDYCFGISVGSGLLRGTLLIYSVPSKERSFRLVSRGNVLMQVIVVY